MGLFERQIVEIVGKDSWQKKVGMQTQTQTQDNTNAGSLLRVVIRAFTSLLLLYGFITHGN